MSRKTYTSRLVDVSFDASLCEHAAECVKGMPEVFNVEARPWINPAAAWTPEAAEILIEVVGRCPSGALQIERPQAQPRVAAEGVEVIDNPEAHRFEARLAGELAGVAEYLLSDGLITFSHTEIDPAFEGRGVGSALARASLEQVRAVGERKVLPLCPFINGWIQRHPEYAALVNR